MNVIQSNKQENNASSLTFEQLKLLFNKPFHQASIELKVDQLELKKRCRELNITRWPYRKRKTLNMLSGNSSVAQPFNCFRIGKQNGIRKTKKSMNKTCFAILILVVVGFKSMNSSKRHYIANTQHCCSKQHRISYNETQQQSLPSIHDLLTNLEMSSQLQHRCYNQTAVTTDAIPIHAMRRESSLRFFLEKL